VISIALVDDRETVDAGFGLARSRTPPGHGDHAHRVGSVSKSVTAIALMQPVEQGASISMHR
jgi:CubicO group peptidase (beta-lactamase class C family)